MREPDWNCFRAFLVASLRCPNATKIQIISILQVNWQKNNIHLQKIIVELEQISVYMEKSKKSASTTDGGKRKKYRKHINHEVTCAVCGKKFGSSRSTAKYCSNKCRRLAYYAAKGYLGRIVPSRVKVPKIGDLLPNGRGTSEMSLLEAQAKVAMAKLEQMSKKTLVFVRNYATAKNVRSATSGELKKVTDYLELGELKARIKKEFGDKAKNIVVADLSYVIVTDAQRVKNAKEGITIEENKAKTVCPELL